MDSHDYEKKNYLSQRWKTIHKIVKKAKKKKRIENKSKDVKKKKNYKKWLEINPWDYGEGKNKKRE